MKTFETLSISILVGFILFGGLLLYGGFLLKKSSSSKSEQTVTQLNQYILTHKNVSYVEICELTNNVEGHIVRVYSLQTKKIFLRTSIACFGE